MQIKAIPAIESHSEFQLDTYLKLSGNIDGLTPNNMIAVFFVAKFTLKKSCLLVMLRW